MLDEDHDSEAHGKGLKTAGQTNIENPEERKMECEITTLSDCCCHKMKTDYYGKNRTLIFGMVIVIWVCAGFVSMCKVCN